MAPFDEPCLVREMPLRLDEEPHIQPNYFPELKIESLRIPITNGTRLIKTKVSCQTGISLLVKQLVNQS